MIVFARRSRNGVNGQEYHHGTYRAKYLAAIGAVCWIVDAIRMADLWKQSHADLSTNFCRA